jgi:protein-tyrosine phosphatase
VNTVLFLCTGNYYRSRFAEVFFNWHAPQRGLKWQAVSRGLALNAQNNGAISRHTVARLAEYGISLEAYQRQPMDVAAEDLEAADHIEADKRT